MKAQLRATAILASSSAVTVLVGFATAKAWALLVGPAGLGLFGLMQSLVGIGGIVFGLGVGTGLVRMGAQAIATGETTRAAALHRSTNLLSVGLGAAAVLVFWLVREPLGERVLGGAERGGDVALLGLAVCFTLVWTAQVSILNAHRRVGGMARFGVAHSVVGSAAGLGILWLLRERGIAAAVAATALCGAAISYHLVRRELAGAPRAQPERSEVRASARALLRFGIPYAASSLVGSGVTLAIPVILVLGHLLGTEEVGYLRASLTLSAGYFGFLLAAMAKDYYPRLSSVSADPREMVGLVNQQIRLATLIGAPLVVVGQLFSAQIVPLLYSREFLPAAGLLEWHLPAQLFVVWSWTLGFVLLARGRSGAFLVSESIGGALLAGATWLGVARYGLPGAGLGYLAAYVCYAGVVWMLARREIGLVIDAQNLRLFAAAVAVCAAIRALPSLFAEPGATVLAGALAAVLVGACLTSLWRHLRPGGSPGGSAPAMDLGAPQLLGGRDA